MFTQTLSRRVLGSPLLDLLTGPHGVDRYTELVEPTWSQGDARARIVAVQHRTPRSVTLTLAPNDAFSGFKAGQHVNLSAEIDGRRRTRCYSPASAEGTSLIELTVGLHDGGLVSTYLHRHARPGMVVGLDGVGGEFVLPDVRPRRILFVSGGSGITPVMSMLRTLDRRDTMPDALVVYSSPDESRMIFREELAALHGKHPSLTVLQRFTDTEGVFALEELAEVCPDWRERGTWACGPAPMLDAAEEFWEQAGVPERLHLERFSLELGDSDAEGGTITFANSGKTVEIDGATTLLEAGEQAGVGMPYGCRIGICHTCTVTMASGRVKDLRTGEEHLDPNESVQTCVTAACGDVTLNV
jgi:ferredoxin-NADP reductase